MEDKPKVKLIGSDGNAFAIMGACRKAWLDAGKDMKEWNKIMEEMMSGNYDNLLNIAMKYFEVV